jgi:hypothetical protein
VPRKLVISELNTKAVIDTGAEVTVLSESFYFNIPENRRPKLKAATRNLFKVDFFMNMIGQFNICYVE